MIEVVLKPGDYFVGGAGYRVRTLLGSCVSITLWHPGRRIGAMCHFLLGRSSTAPGAAPRRDGRYGNDALRLMLEQLDRAGVPAAQCQAGVVGGADMFPQRRRQPSASVGYHNGQAARAMLAAAGIAVVHEDLYGAGHCQLLFDIATGQLWVGRRDPALPAAQPLWQRPAVPRPEPIARTRCQSFPIPT